MNYFLNNNSGLKVLQQSWSIYIKGLKVKFQPSPQLHIWAAKLTSMGKHIPSNEVAYAYLKINSEVL